MTKKNINMANKGGNNEERGIISENTPIRIGLILAFLGLFATSVWWASSITSKLDSILSFQASTVSEITELKSKDTMHDAGIGDLKLRVSLVEVEIKTLKENHNLK